MTRYLTLLLALCALAGATAFALAGSERVSFVEAGVSSPAALADT